MRRLVSAAAPAASWQAAKAQKENHITHRKADGDRNSTAHLLADQCQLFKTGTPS